MIIDVKATRNGANGQAEAQPYHFKEEPKGSAKPLAFGIFLAGLALYLKSMFPGWGQADAETQPDSTPALAGDDPLAPSSRPAKGQKYAAADVEEESAGDEPDQRGSSGKVIDLQQSALFDRLASPDFELATYAVFEFPEASFGFAGPSFAANDNPGPSDAGGNGPVINGPDNPDQPEDNDDDNDDDDDDHIEEPNRAPRSGGPVYLADVAGCAIALIGLSDLLANATDPDGDVLSVRNISTSSGTLTLTQGGWFFEGDGYGPVTITYEITDGALSILQTAHLDVIRNSVVGGSDDDLLVGTDCADDIDGGDGNDNIDARGGNDTTVGGAGSDHIVAGAGGDTVLSGLGNDIVFGGDGDDWISGGKGDDRLFGEAGKDTLFGDEGNDRLSGGLDDDLLFGGDGEDQLLGDQGSDRLMGGEGNDHLLGGDGNDVAMGGAGADRLSGGAGDDTLSGGEGEDEVHAGTGDDMVLGDLDGAADSYDGGEGFDTLSYFAARQALEVDVETGTAKGAEVGEDVFCAFEAIEAGAGDDTILGSAADEWLFGNAGHDQIEAAGGNDVVSGGEGCDTLSGGGGEDRVHAGAGDDTVVADLDGVADEYDGGDGLDTIDYSVAMSSVSFDLVSGRVSGVEVGEDTISNFEIFVGGAGDDYFKIAGHTGSFHGGDGDDVFEFEALSSAGQSVAYEILDFMAGDRIRVSRYEIFEEVMDSLDDRFEDVYGDDIDDDDLPIQISHEYTGNVRRTLIEADLDNDDFYELAITIVHDSQVTVTETVWPISGAHDGTAF